MTTLAPTTAPAAAPVPRKAPAAPRRSTGRGAPDPGLVLTRRGRRALRAAVLTGVTTTLAIGLVLLWLALAAVVAPGAVAGDGGQGVRSGAEASDVGGTTSVVVGPGDTLWRIARTHAPERDPRSVVDQIVDLNALTSTGVQAGASLVVPTS